MTYIDLIIGIVSANVILGLIKTINNLVSSYLGEKIISDEFLRYHGHDFSTLLDVYNLWVDDREFKTIINSIPDNYTSGGMSIIKQDDTYIFNDSGGVATHNRIYSTWDIYNEIKYNLNRNNSVIKKVLNEYKKSKQFNDELKDIINNV